MLRADETTRYLILEMSARGIGHIAYLAGIAPPRIGAVLNVGRAHAGEFGSIDAVAKAKGELVEALPAGSAGGVAVLNADDPNVLAMAQRTPARVVTFSAGAAAPAGPGGPPDADASPAPAVTPGNSGNAGRTAGIRAADIRLDDLGRASFTLHHPRYRAPVQLQAARRPPRGERARRGGGRRRARHGRPGDRRRAAARRPRAARNGWSCTSARTGCS